MGVLPFRIQGRDTTPLNADLKNLGEYVVKLLEYRSVPVSENNKTFCFHPTGSDFVVHLLFRVLPPIQFDDHTALETAEVGCISAERHLTTEPRAINLLPAQP